MVPIRTKILLNPFQVSLVILGRLAFVQYIFQSEFSNSDTNPDIQDFQEHFYNSNIAIIDEKKEFKLKFNKNFLNKLFLNYKKNINKKKLINDLNNIINLNRKFEKWDNILKAIIFAIISGIFRLIGFNLGWGMQFQSPIFLILLLFLLSKETSFSCLLESIHK